MLKIRLQGTKNDIRWFVRLLQRDKRFELNIMSRHFLTMWGQINTSVYMQKCRERKRILIRNPSMQNS